MKKIQQFILDYIHFEYKCDCAKWDINIDNNEYEVIATKAYGFMHSIIDSNSFKRLGILEELLEDEEEREFAIEKIQKFMPRILFQIKHYQNPKLGDTLKRIVTSNNVWACYTSYTEGFDSTGRELCYNKIFYVAETNEGLKIIDSIFFDIITHKWDNPAKESEIYQIGKVIHPGTLVAVEKYHAPEDEICLKDYNKE